MNDIYVENRIHIDKYTATCQEVNDDIAVFCMDQYLDETMKMNGETYETSELRKRINSEEVLSLFPEEIRSKLVPFENGDLVRIPCIEELFEKDEDDILFNMGIHFDTKQWPLMKDRKNRICFRNNEFEWGWLMNRLTSTDFICINRFCDADHSSMCCFGGIRLVFQIKTDTNTQPNDAIIEELKKRISNIEIIMSLRGLR